WSATSTMVFCQLREKEVLRVEFSLLRVGRLVRPRTRAYARRAWRSTPCHQPRTFEPEATRMTLPSLNRLCCMPAAGATERRQLAEDPGQPPGHHGQAEFWLNFESSSLSTPRDRNKLPEIAQISACRLSAVFPR